MSTSVRAAGAIRSSAPPAGELRPWEPPAISRVTLDGADLLFAPSPGRGLVEIHYALALGGFEETPDQHGRASLAGMVLDRGTTTRDARELAAIAEELGGSIGVNVGWERTVVVVEGLGSTLDALLELLFDVVARASFPAEEVETARARRLGDFARRMASPGALADMALSRLLRSPRRDGSPLSGTSTSVASLGREQLVAAHQAALERRPMIVAAGDFDPSTWPERLERALAQHGLASPHPLVAERTAPPPDARRVVVIDRPQAAQSELRIGQAGLSRRDPRRCELLLLDTLLGGAFGSRINLELRERLALTYGARSAARTGRKDGTFEVAAAVDTDRAGLAAERTLALMAEVRDDGPTNTEVETARSWRLGTVPYALQSLGSLAGRCVEIGSFDLPVDDLATTLRRLAEVQRDEVAALAADLLRPQDAAVVVVGPAGELVPQFEALGEVEVWAPEVLDR